MTLSKIQTDFNMFLDTEVKQEKGGILLSQRRYYAIDLLKKATRKSAKQFLLP